MTFPRDHIWQWVGTAPLPVVLSISLATSGLLAGWVWNVQAEVHAQRTVAAVAAVEADTAKATATSAEARLQRMEAKLDRLLDTVAALKVRRQ